MVQQMFTLDSHCAMTPSQMGLDRIACVFLIDASEAFCRQRLVDRSPMDKFWNDQNPTSIDNRIDKFKTHTLPMCKTVDDDEKLRVV